MSDDEASAIVVDDRRDSSKLPKDLDLDPEAPKTIFKMWYVVCQAFKMTSVYYVIRHPLPTQRRMQKTESLK